MKQTIQIAIKRVAVIAVIIGLAGCGGGDSEDSTSPSESTVEDFGGMNKSMDNAFSAMDQAMSTGQAQALALKGVSSSESGSVSCEAGGKISYTGTVEADEQGNGGFDLSLVFDACDDVSGDLRLDGAVSGNEEGFNLDIGFDGTILGDGCELSFGKFRIIMTGNQSEVTAQGKGSLAVECGADFFRCTLDNVSLLDANALDASCSCGGAGCDASFDVDSGEDDDENGSS